MMNLTNPVYLAGKTAYWEGIPSDAIGHCDKDTQIAWLAGWGDAEAEFMQLRSQIAADGRGVLSERGAAVLHSL